MKILCSFDPKPAAIIFHEEMSRLGLTPRAEHNFLHVVPAASPIGDMHPTATNHQ